MKPLDIAIAGCGVAGLAAGLALARQGHKIRLFDQFEAPRALGSGLMLQPAGLDVLDWLGVGDGMRQLGAPIDRLFGRAIPSGRIVLDVRYAALANGRNGLAVHRSALFNVLFDAVKAVGLPIETAARIASSTGPMGSVRSWSRSRGGVSARSISSSTLWAAGHP